MKELDRKEARAALGEALNRRRGSTIGTPLQELYVREYHAATAAEATTFWGATMRVVLPELVSCEIHEYGVIEPALTAFFIDVVDTDTVVFDVGAHLGYYSLLAAGMGAEVHAFEPSRQTLPILERNVRNEVTVVAAGLWSEETTLQLKDFGADHSAVNTFLQAKDESLGEPEVTYEAEVTSLDRYVERTRTVPQLIKIDAEGAELQVLQGGRATIETARPLITVEVGDAADERTSRQAIDFAIRLGYLPYELADGGPHPHTVRDVYEYGNLLLVPDPTTPPG